MFANDTNILIYSVDFDVATKHLTAKKVLRAHSTHFFPIVLQSLTEFYQATTRKRLLTNADAAAFVSDAMTGSPITAASMDDAVEAMRLHDQTGHQFFDCLLLTTAKRAGCTTLFSEDFQHGRDYGGITVRNPFAMDEAELNALLR